MPKYNSPKRTWKYSNDFKVNITSVNSKLCCIVQVCVIAIYTLLLTFIDPSFWLHPFGPIVKNIPIVVLIGYVYASNVNIGSTKI